MFLTLFETRQTLIGETRNKLKHLLFFLGFEKISKNDARYDENKQFRIE